MLCNAQLYNTILYHITFELNIIYKLNYKELNEVNHVDDIKMNFN